jgi:signal transduction histidine kinase
VLLTSKKILLPKALRFHALVFLLLLGFASRAFSAATNSGPADPDFLEASNHLGAWIWSSKTEDQQTCRFWRAFELPRSTVVVEARIRTTADNSYRLFLDGREIGKGSEWRTLNEFNVRPLLKPGRHVLAVEAFSDYSAAGLAFNLHIELGNGRIIEIPSDQKWRVVPEGVEHWESQETADASWPYATIIAAYGEGPWKQMSSRILQAPPLRPIVLAFWQQGWFQITSLSILVIVLLVCLRLAAKLALQSKTQELLHRERARIARDIHDDLGASLTQLVLLGEVAQNDLSPNSETRKQIDGLCEKARDVLKSAEEILWLVNSRRDTLSDFATYVCKYAQGFLNPSPIRCRLEIEPDLPPMPFELPIRRNLFLAVKEAINNAAKYSGATELFLRIHRDGQNIVVVVEDNGKGFDPLLADSDRNGLANMTERMNQVQGVCRINSSQGTGCRIEFVAPLGHSQRKKFWLRWMRRAKPTKENPENAAIDSHPALHPE